MRQYFSLPIIWSVRRTRLVSSNKFQDEYLEEHSTVSLLPILPEFINRSLHSTTLGPA
jgi:hypothetical protein